jgi:hypothetical protein
MQSIEQILADFGVPHERLAVVRLARSLHSVGIKRRRSTPHWQREGFRNCKDARDLVTFARYLPTNH